VPVADARRSGPDQGVTLAGVCTQMDCTADRLGRAADTDTRNVAQRDEPLIPRGRLSGHR